MEKYYTPSAEEFHVGFQCEFKNNMQDNVWLQEVCDVDLVSMALDRIEHQSVDDPFSEEFRVKHLDKEDIESLGWKNKYATINGKDYFVDSEEEIFTLFCAFVGGNVIIMKRQYSRHSCFFDGVIKNKSELKKIMQQLSIQL